MSSACACLRGEKQQPRVLGTLPRRPRGREGVACVSRNSFPPGSQPEPAMDSAREREASGETDSRDGQGTCTRGRSEDPRGKWPSRADRSQGGQGPRAGAAVETQGEAWRGVGLRAGGAWHRRTLPVGPKQHRGRGHGVEETTENKETASSSEMSVWNPEVTRTEPFGSKRAQKRD